MIEVLCKRFIAELKAQHNIEVSYSDLYFKNKEEEILVGYFDIKGTAQWEATVYLDFEDFCYKLGKIRRIM